MTLTFDLRSLNIDKVTFGYQYSITPKNEANLINGRPRRSLVTDRQTNRQTNRGPTAIVIEIITTSKLVIRRLQTRNYDCKTRDYIFQARNSSVQTHNYDFQTRSDFLQPRNYDFHTHNCNLQTRKYIF